MRDNKFDYDYGVETIMTETVYKFYVKQYTDNKYGQFLLLECNI